MPVSRQYECAGSSNSISEMPLSLAVTFGGLASPSAPSLTLDGVQRTMTGASARPNESNPNLSNGSKIWNPPSL